MPKVIRTKTVRPARRTGSRKSGGTVKSAAGPTLYDQLKAFDGRADDLPTDLALRHDHYLYGTVRRTRS